MSSFLTAHQHSGESTFEFRYYSLGSDTAMQGGLYAKLCHAFLEKKCVFKIKFDNYVFQIQIVDFFAVIARKVRKVE